MSYGSGGPVRARVRPRSRKRSGAGSCPSRPPATRTEAGNPAEFPASLPHVLTVAAVGPDGKAAGFSNRNAAVDLSAPGIRDHDRGAAVAGRRRHAGRLRAAERHELLGADGRRGGRLGPPGAARPHRRPARAGRPAVGHATSARRAGRPTAASACCRVGNALAKAPPPADPLEPNDDVEWVDGRGFGSGGRPIFTRHGDGSPDGAARRLRGPGRRLPRQGAPALARAGDRQARFGNPLLSRLPVGRALGRRPRATRTLAALGRRAPSGSRCATAARKSHVYYVALARADGRGRSTPATG